jgi:hypothetical protein
VAQRNRFARVHRAFVHGRALPVFARALSLCMCEDAVSACACLDSISLSEMDLLMVFVTHVEHPELLHLGLGVAVLARKHDGLPAVLVGAANIARLHAPYRTAIGVRRVHIVHQIIQHALGRGPECGGNDQARSTRARSLEQPKKRCSKHGTEIEHPPNWMPPRSAVLDSL